eukprot:1145712-Pelagomonas_calceolata.AAC.8
MYSSMLVRIAVTHSEVPCSAIRGLTDICELEAPAKKEELRRQRKLSPHQLRKRRHIGSKEP